ncbi:MAG: hypothetical protein J7M25_03245 [Deltaproteobacteria bacterium]|nr:hypothetical protein [Deltaproteobacteria bacterium]
MSRSLFLVKSVSLLATLTTLLVQTKARADCTDASRKAIRQINKKAMDAYQNMDFKHARSQLSRAVALAKRKGCSLDWIHAMTMENLAVLSIGGFNRKKLGLRFFREALRIRPETSIDPEVATPLIKRLFRRARRQMRVTERPRPWPKLKSATPIPSGNASPIEHDSIDTAPRGRPLVITCRTNPTLHATSVVLWFRGADDTFSHRAMHHVGRDWTTTLPGRVLWGRSLQYYIVAHDGLGKPLASSGSRYSPNIVSIVSKGGRSETENPFSSGKSRHHKGHRGHKKPIGLWIQIGVGFGAGLARGQTEVMDEEGGVAVRTGKPHDHIEEPGLAPGALSGYLEVGYFVRPRILISLRGRFGYIGMLTKNVPGAAQSDAAGQARVRYFFRPVASRWLRFYVGGGLGFAIIRHTVKETLTAGSFVDTDLSMGIAPSGFGGMTIGTNRWVTGYIETGFIMTIWNKADLFTFHVDGTAGINITF